MRKFFYGISVIVFLCLLSLGFYSSYLRTDRRNSELPSRLPVEDITEGELVNASGDSDDYGLFFLKDKDGFVLVYEGDQTTVYETTGIAVNSLPEKLSQEIRQGKFLKTYEELYSFLENYSS